LRYANRAKNIQNKPRINEDPKDALLREYQYEIARLKEALEKRRIKGKKKNKVNDDNGEEVSDNSDEGEQDISSSDKLADVQAKLEEEKQSILQSTEILEEEKQKLLNAVERRVNQLKKEQKKRDLLASKIKAMESKLLCGGNIIDKTTQQQKALEVQRQAIIDSKVYKMAIDGLLA
jgi:kinesin family protein 3/17